MDLKVYYQKIRELERSFKDPFPVVVSRETPDGGIAGILTEVPAHLAAKMVAEGVAGVASEEDTKAFRAQQAEAKRAAESLEASKRMQVTVVSENDLRALRSSKTQAKS